MNELDLPEYWFEHDENGNRTSLSYLGCLAFLSIGISVAHRIAQYFKIQPSVSLDNIHIDDVLK